MESSFTPFCWCVVLAVSTSHVLLQMLFARWAPEPYMDEIFHVPQTQQYCAGHWDVWDPKITTFPGLYVVGVVAARITGSCDVLTLRALNSVFAVATLLLMRRLVLLLWHRQRRARAASAKSAAVGTVVVPASERRDATIVALALHLLPSHWFFSFLFYTDVGGASCSWPLAPTYTNLRRASDTPGARLPRTLVSVRP